MATAKQIEANRRNARKSTGPKTEEGKSRARWNSLRHGLTAAQPILPHEDEDAFRQLHDDLFDAWQPANAQEALLVEQIVWGQWRMQRAQRFETAILKAAGTGDEMALSLCDPAQQAGYRNLFRYDSRAQATFYRAMDHLRRLQSERRRAGRAPASQPAKPTSLATSAAPPPELASFRTYAPNARPHTSNPLQPLALPGPTPHSGGFPHALMEKSQR